MRKIILGWLGILLAATFLAGNGIALNAQKAEAVADGPGVSVNIPGHGATHIGSYVVSGGGRVYCLEIARSVDRSTAHRDFTTPNSIPGFSYDIHFAGSWETPNVSVPAAVKGTPVYNKMAYLLGVHGETNDNVRAAAVQLAIWIVRNEGASSGYRQLVSNYRSILPSNVNGLADSLVAEANNWVNQGGSIGSPRAGYVEPEAPELAVTSAYAGTVTVAPDTVEVELSGAVFDSTGTNKMTWPTGVSQRSTLTWRSVNTSGWDRFKTVSASGKWEKPGGGVLVQDIKFSPGVTIPSGQIMQAVGYSSSSVEPIKGNFPVSTASLDMEWIPTLTTQTPSEFVEIGEKFSDTVTFNVAPSSNQWRINTKNGSVTFAPIKAKGILYGPFKDDPALNPSATPPAGAPVAGSAEIVTSETKGPSTYEVNPEITAQQAGFYSWVWSISYEDQLEQVKNPPSGEPSLPRDYSFTDGFGVATEGQTVPMTPVISTNLDRDIVRQNAPELKDSVTVQITNGEWMNGANGNPIPVTVRLSVYGTDREVAQSPEVPAGAQLLAEGLVKVEGPGEGYLSPAIAIPETAFIEHNGVTVRACILRDDQPANFQNFFNETCDDYGVPSESAELEWIPELYTNVETKFIDVGDEFNDTVTFHAKGLSVTESHSHGWRKMLDGKGFEQVTAQGVLYGPFDQNPTEFPSATVPNYAQNRIAAAVGIVTDIEKGPGTYEVSVPKALEAGYYTWVWNISGDAQTDYVKWSIPEDYSFSDGFGSANESNIVTTTLNLSTKLNKDAVVMTDLEVQDELQGSLIDGQWLMDETGKRIPATVRLTVYAGQGALEQQKTVPESTPEKEVKELAHTHVILKKPDAPVLTQNIEIPIRDFLKFDHLTVQACILKDDQPEELQGYMKEVCDDYGLPAESAVFVKPTVTTKAQEKGAYQGEIRDVATLAGSDVPQGSQIEFTAYLKPEVGTPKYDENWEEIITEDGDVVLWEEEEFNDLDSAHAAAMCEAQPVAKTARIDVSKMGDYESEPVIAKSLGTIYWVEELFVTDPDDPETEISVHRGECGLPEETTMITLPEVKTKAKPKSAAGASIYDTAIVTGELADREGISYEVTFEAFHKAQDSETADAQVCSPENKVWESNEPIKVHSTGEYKSETWKTEDDHKGEIFWVETLWLVDAAEESTAELHRGECGEPEEITVITEPKLPLTGGSVPGYALAFLALGMTVTGGALMLRN